MTDAWETLRAVLAAQRPAMDAIAWYNQERGSPSLFGPDSLAVQKVMDHYNWSRERVLHLPVAHLAWFLAEADGAFNPAPDSGDA